MYNQNLHKNYPIPKTQQTSFFLKYLLDNISVQPQLQPFKNPIELFRHYLFEVDNEYITYFLYYTLKFEFSVLKKHNVISNKKTLEQFLNESIFDTSFVEYVFQKYPYLYAKSISFLTNQIRQLNDISSFLEGNASEIHKRFKFDSTGVNFIVPYRGDLHIYNRSTCFLISGDSVLVFKNRPIYYEERVYELLKKLNISTKFPESLTDGTFSVVEFVRATFLSTIKEVDNYYFQLGKLLGVAFILSAEDLISDNLIVFNGSPLLIDCEVFSSPPRFVSINDNPLTFINSSVLSTGLLPHDFDENRSFPSSPLVKASGKAVSKLNHFEVEGGKSVFEENYHNLIPTYLPISNNKGYTVHKFKSSFIKGFRVMVSDPEYLEKINMFLSGLTFSRLLARNTQDYDHVLRESNRPKYLKSEKATLNFLSKVISGKDKFPNFHKEEINQLLRGDIPFFYTNAKTRGIYNPNKESVETVVFSHSPYEHFLDRLSLLSDKKFVVKQVSIINNTIFHSDSLDNNLFEVFGDTSFLVFSESGKKIIREAILDYLKSSSIVIDDELFFTGIAHDGVSPTYSFSLIDEDLYAGSGGVLLVLLMIKDEYWDPLIKKKLDAIVKEAVDFLILDMSAQSDINDVKFISAFHFPSIILHFIFAGYISGTLSKEIITLYELWIIRRFKHDTIGDYLLGMSSVIHLVFNNASYFTQNFLSSIESRYYQMLKKKCFQYKDSIYFKFFERTEELNVGLCHGNIGVAVALSSILKYQNSSEIKNLLVEVFKYICYSIDDNKLDFFSNHQKERLTLPSYNHGISGLVVLLIENPDLLVSERRKRLFEKFISDVIHFSSNINNFTLANGAIGNIIIALWLLQKEEKRSLISPNIRSDFQLFINKITVHDLFRNSHSPKMFLNPDLYGGLTGLLYLLLFKDSKHTYNIFSFQKS